MGQRSQCGPHIVAVAADFNAQGTLPGGGQHGGGLENLADAFTQAQALETGSGQHDGLVLTLVELAQPGVEVAAQRLNAHIAAAQGGQRLAQQHQAAQAGGAHHGTGRQVGQARAVGRHPGIARVFAVHHAGQRKPGGQLHRHIFERMHGQVGPAFFQCGFQLLDEQALATHLAQGAVQNLVAPGGHAQQGDGVPQAFEQRLDVFGLPQCQTALAGGYGEMEARRGRRGSSVGHGGQKIERTAFVTFLQRLVARWMLACKLLKKAAKASPQLPQTITPASRQSAPDLHLIRP